MYIIVVGGGEVGYYLSKVLINDGHEVLILEKEAERSKFIFEELGDVVVRGDGCEARTLEEVGTGRADMLIAVTGDDEDNLVACQVAKHRFNVPRTIARIKNPKNKVLFEKLGIDVTVSSTDLILAHIEPELPYHPLVPLLDLRDRGFKLVGIKIPPDSKIAGRKLRDLKLPGKSIVCLIIGKEKGPQIPSQESTLEAGDEVVVVTESGAEEELRALLTGI